MRAPTALVFDIDDTLVPFRAAELPPSTKEAISLARQNGHSLFLATGRSKVYILPWIIEEVQPRAITSCNGMMQYTPEGDILSLHRFDEESFLGVVNDCLQSDIAFACKFPQGMAVYNRYERFCDFYLVGGATRAGLKDDTLLRSTHEEWGMPLDLFMHGDLETIFSFMKKYPSLQTVKARSQAAEAYPASFNKATGVREMLESCGFRLEEAICFGDSQNDREMLKEAGIGVAMGNASDEVKACADYVTSDVKEDGIYNAFRHLELI